ncbi:hypothetical protein [Pleionea sp. CnH1-48]|uniref:hypothetical protein n=1 Tax=Pleionea sp. CnH1-48 TaxID=2954494 RepID=UPI00209779AA|nr:hypothetical protein [Pleionea sp. CnH1-48]MCO7225593.1 hypothetical protein [Pleionea sp. CnH1-48]
MDVFQYSTTKENYDLILLDYPIIDRYGHALFQLTHNTDDTISPKYKTIIESAYQRMDNNLARTNTYAKANGNELLVTQDMASLLLIQ